jgi:predicted enzyme related to lactoylglutathione lyase
MGFLDSRGAFVLGTLTRGQRECYFQPCAEMGDSMPTISKTRFVIAVPDLISSAAFYRDVLGFTIDQVSDTGWLFYTSGDCIIMAGECPDAIPPRKLGDHSYFAYLQIDEIDSFYASVLASGAEICEAIRDEPWGMREFGLVTVDGHRIMFAAPKS